MRLHVDVIDFYGRFFLENLTFLANLTFFSLFFIGACIVQFDKFSAKRFNSLLNWGVIISAMIFLLLFSAKFYLVHLGYFVPASLVQASSLWLLSNVLIILALTITLVSLLYLSERRLFEMSLHPAYFFIFSVCTLNMVNTMNLLLMFTFFEFIFLPSLFFVYKFGYSKKVNKTVGYLLVWTLSGSFLVLCGLGYLYGIAGSLEIELLTQLNFSSFEKNILFVIFFVGFGVKIPVWPFHYWLTKVHVEAPTGFSIFLSGFLVKTALYCVVTLLPLFSTSQLKLSVIAILVWGFLDASFRMWTSTDIKRLIAFATIQEMNMLFLFFVLLSDTNLKFFNLFVLVHGLLSALLFFLVDIFQKRSHTRNLTAVSGFAFSAPKLHLLVWFAILIFRGFPIFVKFFLEWELMHFLVLNFHSFGFIIFAGAVLTGVLGFCRIWFLLLYGQPQSTVTVTPDILKTDVLVGSGLCFLLFCSTFCLYLFDGWCY